MGNELEDKTAEQNDLSARVAEEAKGFSDRVSGAIKERNEAGLRGNAAYMGAGVGFYNAVQQFRTSDMGEAAQRDFADAGQQFADAWAEAHGMQPGQVRAQMTFDRNGEPHVRLYQGEDNFPVNYSYEKMEEHLRKNGYLDETDKALKGQLGIAEPATAESAQPASGKPAKYSNPILELNAAMKDVMPGLRAAAFEQAIKDLGIDEQTAQTIRASMNEMGDGFYGAAPASRGSSGTGRGSTGGGTVEDFLGGTSGGGSSQPDGGVVNEWDKRLGNSAGDGGDKAAKSAEPTGAEPAAPVSGQPQGATQVSPAEPSAEKSSERPKTRWEAMQDSKPKTQAEALAAAGMLPGGASTATPNARGENAARAAEMMSKAKQNTEGAETPANGDDKVELVLGAPKSEAKAAQEKAKPAEPEPYMVGEANLRDEKQLAKVERNLRKQGFVVREVNGEYYMWHPQAKVWMAADGHTVVERNGSFVDSGTAPGKLQYETNGAQIWKAKGPGGQGDADVTQLKRQVREDIPENFLKYLAFKNGGAESEAQLNGTENGVGRTQYSSKRGVPEVRTRKDKYGNVVEVGIRQTGGGTGEKTEDAEHKTTNREEARISAFESGENGKEGASAKARALADRVNKSSAALEKKYPHGGDNALKEENAFNKEAIAEFEKMDRKHQQYFLDHLDEFSEKKFLAALKAEMSWRENNRDEVVEDFANKRTAQVRDRLSKLSEKQLAKYEKWYDSLDEVPTNAEIEAFLKKL